MHVDQACGGLGAACGVGCGAQAALQAGGGQGAVQGRGVQAIGGQLARPGVGGPVPAPHQLAACHLRGQRVYLNGGGRCSCARVHLASRVQCRDRQALLVQRAAGRVGEGNVNRPCVGLPWRGLCPARQAGLRQCGPQGGQVQFSQLGVQAADRLGGPGCQRCLQLRRRGRLAGAGLAGQGGVCVQLGLRCGQVAGHVGRELSLPGVCRLACGWLGGVGGQRTVDVAAQRGFYAQWRMCLGARLQRVAGATSGCIAGLHLCVQGQVVGPVGGRRVVHMLPVQLVHHQCLRTVVGERANVKHQLHRRGPAVERPGQGQVGRWCQRGGAGRAVVGDVHCLSLERQPQTAALRGGVACACVGRVMSQPLPLHLRLPGLNGHAVVLPAQVAQRPATSHGGTGGGPAQLGQCRHKRAGQGQQPGQRVGAAGPQPGSHQQSNKGGQHGAGQPQREALGGGAQHLCQAVEPGWRTQNTNPTDMCNRTLRVCTPQARSACRGPTGVL